MLNEDDKTELRLVLIEGSFSAPDRKLKGNLECRVRLMQVVGYEQEFTRMQTQALGRFKQGGLAWIGKYSGFRTNSRIAFT